MHGRAFLVALGLAWATIPAYGQDEKPAAAEAVPEIQETNCLLCHGNTDLWEGETLRLLVTPEHLKGDVHWKKGLNCHDCHGGNPETTNVREAHAVEDGFRKITSLADEPAFCGKCHADAQYMGKHQASPRLDHVEKFWESAHGRHLKSLGNVPRTPAPPAADAPAAAPAASQEGEKPAEQEKQETKDPKPTASLPDAAALAAALKPAVCSSCHPKHNVKSARDPESSTHPTRLVETCGSCHQKEKQLVASDVHTVAHRSPAVAQGGPLDCLKCHTGDIHAILPVKDHRSSMFLDRQVQVCGDCHQKEAQQYHDSVHGHGLSKLGLLVTASCSDCHGAHGIHPATDERSSLHQVNVSKTCGSCHRFIEERLQKSIHGQGAGPGGPATRLAPGGKAMQKPSCTSCHQGHDLPHPTSPAFRHDSADRCGNCHTDLLDRYAMSTHGQLAELGYAPAARCSDCHGAHDILGLNNPDSMVGSVERRIQTCKQCHPGANVNFVRFDPHADHRDAKNYPVLHYVTLGMHLLLFSVFTFFGFHTLLWLIRSTLATLKHGRPKRPKPAQKAYVRFAPIHRVLHAVMIVSFLGLALTGLPLKYADQAWAKDLATWLGGFGTTKIWHHAFGIVTFGYFGVHLIWLVGQIAARRREGGTWLQIFLGPDSMVPTFKDLRDLFGMFGWFFGIAKKPSFDRWTYWEKFDYWAVFWGVAIIGSSGMLLWYPEFFCRFLPGEIHNIAKVIHSEEALLATGFIFTIHFFNTHLRAEKFPMDMSMLTGMVSSEELEEERPAYVERMKRCGKLEELAAIGPSRGPWLLMMLGGALALLVGLGLLVGILISAF